MRNFLIFLFLFLNTVVVSQDEINSSSISEVRDTSIVIDASFVPNPRKALLYSLLLPAGGQIYNRKYWKIPLVLGAYGGLIYAFDFNGTQYRILKKAYEYRLDGLDSTDPDLLVNPAVPDASIRRVRDRYRKNLELTYMAAIVVHALSGIEAFVDAHLQNFDVSEDLSIQIRPTYESGSLVGAQTGVGVYITF